MKLNKLIRLMAVIIIAICLFDNSLAGTFICLILAVATAILMDKEEKQLTKQQNYERE